MRAIVLNCHCYSVRHAGTIHYTVLSRASTNGRLVLNGQIFEVSACAKKLSECTLGDPTIHGIIKIGYTEMGAYLEEEIVY